MSGDICDHVRKLFSSVNCLQYLCAECFQLSTVMNFIYFFIPNCLLTDVVKVWETRRVNTEVEVVVVMIATWVMIISSWWDCYYLSLMRNCDVWDVADMKLFGVVLEIIAIIMMMIWQDVIWCDSSGSIPINACLCVCQPFQQHWLHSTFSVRRRRNPLQQCWLLTEHVSFWCPEGQNSRPDARWPGGPL